MPELAEIVRVTRLFRRATPAHRVAKTTLRITRGLVVSQRAVVMYGLCSN